MIIELWLCCLSNSVTTAASQLFAVFGTVLCYLIQCCQKRRKQSSKHMMRLTRHLKRSHVASQSQLQLLNIPQKIVTMRTWTALDMQITSRWIARLWSKKVKKSKQCMQLALTSLSLLQQTQHAIWDHTSITCHPAVVRIASLPPAEAGTRYSNHRGMQGWVDLCYVKADQLGIEPTTCKSQVQRPTTKPPRNSISTLQFIRSINGGRPETTKVKRMILPILPERQCAEK